MVIVVIPHRCGEERHVLVYCRLCIVCHCHEASQASSQGLSGDFQCRLVELQLYFIEEVQSCSALWGVTRYGCRIASDCIRNKSIPPLMPGAAACRIEISTSIADYAFPTCRFVIGSSETHSRIGFASGIIHIVREDAFRILLQRKLADLKSWSRYINLRPELTIVDIHGQKRHIQVVLRERGVHLHVPFEGGPTYPGFVVRVHARFAGGIVLPAR